MKIAIYNNPSYYRSRSLAQAASIGCRRHGHIAPVFNTGEYRGVKGDAAVFYGFAGNCPRMFDAYRARGLPVVVMDLGYWVRDSRKRMKGYNKVTVNSRHPDAYFQKRPHGSGRFDRLGLTIAPWRECGKHILVCGMSAKAANAAGLRFLEWENAIVKEIRKVSDRPIVFRPKPSRKGGVAYISGTEQFPDHWPIQDCLQDAHICVARHSNACADALLAGVPVHCEEGVASAMSTPIAEIENPRMPDGRQQWANDVAYCQWTLDEINKGECWAHLKSEGLVP